MKDQIYGPIQPNFMSPKQKAKHWKSSELGEYIPPLVILCLCKHPRGIPIHHSYFALDARLCMQPTLSLCDFLLYCLLNCKGYQSTLLDNYFFSSPYIFIEFPNCSSPVKFLIQMKIYSMQKNAPLIRATTFFNSNIAPTKILKDQQRYFLGMYEDFPIRRYMLVDIRWQGER